MEEVSVRNRYNLKKILQRLYMQVCVECTPGLGCSQDVTSMAPRCYLSFSTMGPLCFLEFRGPKEVAHRISRGSNENKSMKYYQTSPVFDSSSHHFPNTVPKNELLPRRNYQTSHQYPKTVTSRRKLRHIFEKVR